MANSNTYQEAVQLDRGSTVLVSSWILITLSAFFVIARGVARKKLFNLESGDILLPLALTLAFVQTTCVQLAVDNGLGRMNDSYEAQAVSDRQEVMYWAQLLYILVLGLTKTTIVLLILPLGPPRLLRYACYIVAAQVILSNLAFLFVSAFQCRLPNPWDVDGHQCVNISALGRALAVTTVVTDIFALSIPVAAMILLNLNYDSRIFICSLLASRLLVPAFVVVQFAYLVIYDTSANPAYDGALIQIWTQVVLNLSIITACIPPLGCILSDIALALVGRRMIPDTISWGRYSPEGISRIHMLYEDKHFKPLETDKIPLCSGGLGVGDKQHTFPQPKHTREPEKDNLAWFEPNTTPGITVFPQSQRQGQSTKQVRFEDIPPMPRTPPSMRYPENKVRSTTLDVLSYSTYIMQPGQYENPTMPPPAIPVAKPPSLQRRLSNALIHKRNHSGASTTTTTSLTKISEPSFVCASTLVTPPSSRAGGTSHRESFQFHRPTRSTGSIRPPSSIYSNRGSFIRGHRMSKSMTAFPFRRSRGSTIWPGWFERWENKIDEEANPLGTGSFVNVDEEFERCRNRHGRNQR